MSSEVEVSDEWRRLHPLTILKELGALAWALLAAVFFDWDFDFGLFSDQVASSENVIAVGVFVYAVARYLFTSYRVTREAVELKRGVLVRSFQSMPRERIQSVGTKTGLFARVVGVTTVEVSAADAEDIQLSYVSEEASSYLRGILEPAGTSGEEEGSEPVSIKPLARLEASRILIFGLTEPGIAAALLVLGVTSALAGLFGWLIAPIAAVALVTVPVVRTLALVDFKAWIEGDSVKVESGLLARRHSAAPRRRIQAIQVSRPLVRRWLGFETTTMATGDVSVDADSLVGVGMLAPLEPRGSWQALAAQLIGTVNLDERFLARSSRRTVRRSIVRGVLIVAVVAVAVGAAAEVAGVGWLFPVGAVGLVGGGVVVSYSIARWVTMGWAMDGDHLMLRRGVVTRRTTIVPVAKAQDVTVRSTFFQRRLGLATVEVDTAGVNLAGRVLAVDLEEDIARELAARLAAAAARIALPDGV